VNYTAKAVFVAPVSKYRMPIGYNSLISQFANGSLAFLHSTKGLHTLLDIVLTMSYKLLRFYPRDAMLAGVFAIATCLSVRPSVTSRYCVKTKKASVMISSPSGSPAILVF